MSETQSENDQVPRWDLSGIYGGFDSPAYISDRARLREAAEAFNVLSADRAQCLESPRSWLSETLDRLNEVIDLEETLSSYAYAVYSCATNDPRALRVIDAIEQDTLPSVAGRSHFRSGLRVIAPLLDSLTNEDARLYSYRFFLERELIYEGHQMSADEEALAADLARSGADAWGRLQDSVSSNLSVRWDGDTGEERTVSELRSLAHHPRRDVRRHAWQCELGAWRTMETPLAFAINGVKGNTLSVNARRGYSDPLDRARLDARITQTTLTTLLEVVEHSLPVFRRYLRAKARVLGIERLAFYDLFAPVGTSGRAWSFSEARAFIERAFRSFSSDLASFAASAFDANWVDALPRRGKVGGAYSISMPRARSSRILANYDRTFSSVATLAHELGHAYHYELLKDYPAILRDCPMTLAETASVFCETLLFNHALHETAGGEKLYILDAFLQNATQLVVDILSRFYFEQSVFDSRQSGDLSAEELKSLMLDAQKRAYGDGIDTSQLHPYMWAAKPHYYIPSLSFYNFPYTFGTLFATGLFRLFENDPDGFPEIYRTLVAMTGSASAERVTREAGFDIEQPEFWKTGISIIERHVAEFERIAS